MGGQVKGGARGGRVLVIAAALVAATVGAAVGVTGAPLRSVAGAAQLAITPLWHELLGTNTGIYESSPNVATLDGDGPSIVVGSRDNGTVYAVHLVDGTTVAGWPHSLGAGIDSTPSVEPTGSGTDNVFVSTGSVVPGALNPGQGWLWGFGSAGNVIWNRPLGDVFGLYGPSPAVVASPALGDPGTGAPTIVAGDVGQSLYSVDPGSGGTNPGWPQPTPDTTFATAAIANIDGLQRIVTASDSSGPAGNGGQVSLRSTGGGILWSNHSNQVVTSSPAVGNLDGSGPVVAFGHGTYFAFAGDSDGLTLVDATTGNTRWEAHLGGYTQASPALADLTGNGQLDVVEPTFSALGQSAGGVVDAFGPAGNQLWGPVTLPEPPGFQGSNPNTVVGGVATADFGEGYQDVVVASGLGWDILDGRSGAVVSDQTFGGTDGLDIDWTSRLGNLNMENSPLVVPDPSGSGLDVVVAGTVGDGSGQNQGFIAAYRVTGSNSVGSGAWPQFHHDPALSGSAIPPAPPAGSCLPDAPPCSAEGYWEVASDGGIFTFGAAGFQGSAGSIPLNRPVVGMARDQVTGGYWEVASDGGIFSYGAPFFGSTGSIRLNQPIVGMAATRDGGGYWLVASDGGVFAFGDAPFLGSMGGTRLNAPVVGVAADPATGGYWLVASDGGMFSFGAPFLGSMGGRPLNAPVVGMTALPSGGGYRLVASDGGLFNFGGGGFFGSMGGQALYRPVVGMASTSDGGGYWLVASDGGIFSFGDAFFRASMGGRYMNRPIVGIAAVGP